MADFPSAEQQNARTGEAVVDLEQENDRPIGFLDLSAELRNMVYEHLLPADRALKISTFGGQQYISMFDSDALTLIRLGRTNRQLNVEITPVIYHNVTFARVNAPAIKWLKDIGPRKQMIRHVSFHICLKASLVSFLHQLKQANSLQSLTIGFSAQLLSMRLEGNRHDMARVLAPFIKAHHKAKRGANAISDIIRMIHAEPGTHQGVDVPVGRQYQDRLRAKLEEILS